MNKNGEGYVDPTPGAAFGNIRREEHKREADRLSVISNKRHKDVSRDGGQ